MYVLCMYVTMWLLCTYLLGNTVWHKILTVENIDESGLEKIWRVKVWRMPMCSFVVIVTIMLIVHAALLLHIAIYSYVVRKSYYVPVCTCISTCIVIDININQPHLCWVAAGYVWAWQRARDITSQWVHWLVFMCPGMLEHSFTIY